MFTSKVEALNTTQARVLFSIAKDKELFPVHRTFTFNNGEEMLRFCRAINAKHYSKCMLYRAFTSQGFVLQYDSLSIEQTSCGELTFKRKNFKKLG